MSPCSKTVTVYSAISCQSPLRSILNNLTPSLPYFAVVSLDVIVIVIGIVMFNGFRFIIYIIACYQLSINTADNT